MTTPDDSRLAQILAFGTIQAIHDGQLDKFLHRLHGAILLRQETPEYKATLVAGRPRSPS